MFTRNSIVLSNNIKTPLTAISRAIGNILQLTYGQLVKQLFSNQEQGFAYDPNDLTTLYQDAAGTTPVTAAGQTVGLMLDKSKGLALGVELITQPLDFTNWTKTAAVTSFTANSFTTNAGGGVTLQLFGGSSSKAYCITMKGTSTTVGTLRNDGTGSVGTTIPMGAFDIVMNTPTLASFGTSLYIALGSAGTITVDSISVKELAGNHAYQTVSASRPILQQSPILGSEMAYKNLWTVPQTANTFEVLSDGRSKVTCQSTTEPRIAQNITAVTGKSYEVSIDVEAIGADAIVGTQSSVYSRSGGITFATVPAGTRKTVKAVFTANDLSAKVGASITNTVRVSVILGDVSVKEITGYRTGQNYLAFDGVDDFLQTNNIDFTMTDKISLFAGVRKLSDAARGVLLELGSAVGLTSGSFGIEAPRLNTVNAYGFTHQGSANPGAVATSGDLYPAPHSAVLVGKGNLSNTLSESIKVNSTITVGPNTTLGANTKYGNYPLYIGRRAGTSLPFNGHLYSLIGIGRLTTDSETITLEKAIAKNTGVTLNV